MQIYLLLTEKCNLHCAMCIRGSQEGKNLSYDELKKILDVQSFRNHDVVLTGGEPSLHKDFVKIIRLMCKNANQPLKRIFYFNIIYSCNSRCVFCYSHNTVFGIKDHIAISAKDFISYLHGQKISQEDRVIVNGGEPLLHSELGEILNYLLDVGCEVLVYSNGRLLSQKPMPNLNKNFRFIIPIHGDEKIHDNITRIKGSFWETVKGLEYLVSKQNCLLDLKFIINNEFVKKS